MVLRLMRLINVSFFQLPRRGRSCHPGHYICFYDMKARRKASLLTATRKLENIFPSIPSVWLHVHLPNGWCAHTFAGINLVVYLDFPSLMCLNEITGHFCGQIYPKLELSFWGIPANRAHTQSESPPTAITDSTRRYGAVSTLDCLLH